MKFGMPSGPTHGGHFMPSNQAAFWFHAALALTLAQPGGAQETRALEAGLAFQGAPLVEFEDIAGTSRIHPTKMAVGKDRKIYFNTSSAIVYRVDEAGVLEKVAILPNAGGSPDDDFTIGMTFDPAGNLFVSNLTGVYRIGARELRPAVLDQPVPSVKLVELPEDLLFPMGLAADRQGNLFLSDIFGGAIYRIEVDEGRIAPWFRSPELSAPAVVPSNNLFGIGFGVTDLAMGNRGKYLYFGTQETHRIYRLGIEPGGAPGALEELAHVPTLAFNGLSFDMIGKRLYLSVPWDHFENGIQVATNPVGVAGSIWAIDIRAMERDGFATPVELIRDVDLGTTVDVVSGFDFGFGPEHARRLYVTDSSLDTFFWLNGDPNGTPLPADDQPEAGVPFPTNAYHAAIRVVELDE